MLPQDLEVGMTGRVRLGVFAGVAALLLGLVAVTPAAASTPSSGAKSTAETHCVLNMVTNKTSCVTDVEDRGGQEGCGR